MPEFLSEVVTPERAEDLIRAALLVVIGLPAVYLCARLAARAARDRMSAQGVMLLRKGITYLGIVIVLVSVLGQFGFQLTALLGAAGIFGVAIGFAAQTSLSNIISGVFLIWEKPFAVGDVVKIGDTLGIALSIDLLSVKLKTFDNQFIRIPNETLIKTEVRNITRFPIRRLDVFVGVAYKEDVQRVKDVLADIAHKNPHCLDEPEPLVLFVDYGDSALEFLLGAWFYKTDYILLKNSIMQDIKERFDAEGIEIPFPHRTVYTGAASDPFPIRIVDGKQELVEATGDEDA
jgi:small-conductance mechanosensitive channel